MTAAVTRGQSGAKQRSPQMAKKKSSLRNIEHEPFTYRTSREKRQRLAHVLSTYGELIPRIYLALMFGRAPGSITERLKRLYPERTRRDGVNLFGRWLKNDLIDSLTELTYPERLYLKDLRLKILKEYYKQRSPDVDEVAAELQQRLRAAANDSSECTERSRCTAKDCPNRFPATAEFFPNLRHGGKKPGQCAVCAYRKRAQAGRRYRREGAIQSRGVVLSKKQRTRFWQIEKALRRELPTRVLAVMFGIQSTTVNNLRKKPLPRKEGKAVFHRFQTLEEAPRFDMLTEAESRSVHEEWLAIRSELSRADFDSGEARIGDLLQYTAAQLRRDPDTPFKACEGCEHNFAADDYCFPYGRKRTTREKVLRNRCRVCY